MDTSHNHGTLGKAERHSIAELSIYHRNPRVGNVDVIMESMRANGIYKPLIVNRGTHTGRPMEVLAGNHSLKALRRLAEGTPKDERWQQVDTYVVDVDDDAAARIVLADNKTSDAGTYDLEMLSQVLQQLDGDIEGTGYVDDDVSDLLAALEEATPALPPTPDSVPVYASHDDSGDGWDDDADDDDDKPDGISHITGGAASAPGYSERVNRIMMLHLSIEQFVWAQEMLDRYHTEHPETDGANALAVLMIMGQHFGEDAPMSEGRIDGELDGDDDE